MPAERLANSASFSLTRNGAVTYGDDDWFLLVRSEDRSTLGAMSMRRRLMIVFGSGVLLVASAAFGAWRVDWRPPSAHDFRQLKIAYIDLYALNSERFQLAGSPEFPIVTDSRRPADGEDVIKLGNSMFRELLYSLAYRSDSEPALIRGPRLIVQRAYSSAMLSHARGVSIANNGSRRVEGVGLTPIVQDAGVLGVETPLSRDADAREIARALFARFMTEKKNGPNPLGDDFKIRYVDMVEVYGYGQCHSLSYALARTLARHGLKASIVNTGPVRHTFVEADLGNVKAVLDPLLGIALIDSTASTSYSRDYVLRNAGSIESTLPQAVRAPFRQYYLNASIVDTESVTYRKSDDRTRTFALEPGDTAQYIFGRVYPWITSRNLAPPPEGAVGFLRISRNLVASEFRQRGDWSITLIETPYPIVDLEILLPAGTHPDFMLLTANSEKQIHINGNPSLIRLARYLKGDGTQYSVTLGVKREAGKNFAIRVRAISQFALPRFQADTTQRFEVIGGAPDSLDAYVNR